MNFKEKKIRAFVKCSFVMLVVLLSVSCTTTKYASLQQDYSNAMVGKTHQQIVSMLGAPDRQTSDGDGGTILIYEEYTHESIATAHNVNYYTGTYTPGSTTTTYTEYLHVYISKTGVCYNVKTNHIKSWKEKSLGKTIGLLAGIFIPIIAALIAGLAGG